MALGSCVRRSAIVGRSDSGFSLIEALVALAVLAIATVGLMRAVESHIDSTRGLERRAAAMWVAENRLAELEAGIPGSDQVEMLGQAWKVATVRQRTDDPEIERVRINVTPANENAALASLDGFVDGRRR
ncbi:MAG: type II secretion system minor pseudopilin GspI [Pseudomonadota bacterium]